MGNKVIGKMFAIQDSAPPRGFGEVQLKVQERNPQPNHDGSDDSILSGKS